MRHLFALLIACLTFGLALPSAATDWSAVEARLRTVVTSPDFVEAVLDHYQLQGSARAAMRSHLSALYRSDEVVRALVAEMREAGVDRNEELLAGRGMQVGRRFGAELFQSWAIKGLARLPAADQRRFYDFILQWMDVASPDDCKRLMFADEQSALDNGRLEMKYYARLSRGQLDAYFALLRKAVLAELRDFPSTRSLNSEQVQIADQAYQARLEQAAQRDDVALETLLAMADPTAAPARAACDAGKLMFRTLLEMKGFAADLVVLKMVLSAQ